MKRAHSALIALLTALVVWLWLAGQVDSQWVWLALPLIPLGLFGFYSLFTSLKSVAILKDFPEEERSLKEDIQRARNFYAEKGLKL